jgi:hypothetical protein
LLLLVNPFVFVCRVLPWHMAPLSVLDVHPNTIDRYVVEKLFLNYSDPLLHPPCTECEGHLEAYALLLVVIDASRWYDRH